VVKDEEFYMKNGISFSIYMFHGGTNFGFWNGANYGGFYQPHITSYDYDAPLNEAGQATPKYLAIREMIGRYVGALPDVPAAQPVVRVSKFDLAESASLQSCLGAPTQSEDVKPMESLGQGYGFVQYRTRLKGPSVGRLTLRDVRDYAVVMLDGATVKTLDRRRKESALDISITKPDAVLDILVENWGRINYGRELTQNLKGITQSVTFDGAPLKGWEIYNLPLDTLPKLDYADVRYRPATPTFYKGSFEISTAGDTWLDMRGWTKGVVWVNGKNLGRFFFVGPQQTLYCPGCWLKSGQNEVVVLELSPTGVHGIEGLDHALLDDLVAEATSKPLRPEMDVKPQPGNGDLIASGDLPAGHGWHDISVKESTARFLALEGTSWQAGDQFCSMAELWVLDASGNELDRTKWKVIYADSEETIAEDNRAENLIDGDPSTIWHSVWAEDHKPLPHFVVIDFGAPVTFSAVRLQPRADNESAIMKGYRLYASMTPFGGR
jgi:beta-galactosidase